MADASTFLQDLAVITGVAAVTSILFQRLKFPLVFGLLAAGVVIGPNTPPFSLVTDEATLETLANLGVVLLLFGLGLDFNLRGLRKVGFAALVVTVVEVGLMFWFGYEAGRYLGWDVLDSVFLGAMLSISSTAIIVSVLRELGRLDAESSRLIFAVLVLEDLLAILILVLLGGYASTGSLPWQQTALVVGRIVVFLLIALAFGLLAVPWLLDRVATRGRPEVVVLTTLGLALGAAVLSQWLGFHAGLGAFVAGTLAAESKHREKLEAQVRPVHDLFAAVFFVSIGTLVDFRVLADYWAPVLFITLVIIVGKFLSGFLATFLAGHPGRSGVEVGAALAQVGEFSFVIATVGLATATMSEFLFPIIVGVAALTSFVSPLLIRAGPRLADLGARVLPASLRTYGSAYTGWMRSQTNRTAAHNPAARTARRNGLIALLLMVAILGAAALGSKQLRTWIEARGFSSPEALLILTGLALVVALPLAVQGIRESRRWLVAMTSAGASAPGVGIRAVVQASFWVAAIILIGIPVVAASRPFIRSPFVLAIWLAILLVAGILLWRRIQRLHQRVTENVQGLLREQEVSMPVSEVVQALFRRGLPEPIGVDVVELSPNAVAVGRRVGELKLRTSTGATLLLVERADGLHVQPEPGTTFLPNDRLTLIGDREQLAAAKTLLTPARERFRGGPGLQPGQLFLPPGGPWIGKTLEEAGIRTSYGLQVVAIVRGSITLANPGSKETLMAEDTLVVVGDSRQLIAAQESLQVPPAAADPEAPKPPP